MLRGKTADRKEQRIFAQKKTPVGRRCTLDSINDLRFSFWYGSSKG
jgi:hypothetical protein